MAHVWAARELCTHSDAFLVQGEGASISFLPAITVCCSTLHVSPHQHGSITRSTLNFQQQLSCHTVPDPIPRRKVYMCCQYNTSQPPLTRVFHHHRKGLCTQQWHWDAATRGNVALWFLPAAHTSASPCLSPHILCCSCNTSYGPTAAPRAVPHTETPCSGREKPLTPEHQCPPAAGPVSLSQPPGLGNGPRSPALWKQKRKVRASATV